MRGIGISGVSGVGKRRLAVAFAAETDNMLLPLCAAKMLRGTRTKFTTAGIISEYRLILAELESAYAASSKRFVTNMTPLDLMTELYSIFTWFNKPSKEAEKQVKELLAESCRVCSKYLSVIMYIQPLNSGAREEHLNALGAGLMHTQLVNHVESSMFTIGRNTVDLNERVEALKRFVYDRYEEESPYRFPVALRH